MLPNFACAKSFIFIAPKIGCYYWPEGWPLQQL